MEVKVKRERLKWIAEMDYSGRVVQVYAVCRDHAKELLNRKPKPVNPTYFIRITRRQADRILRREMGYGAWANGCDLCD